VAALHQALIKAANQRARLEDEWVNEIAARENAEQRFLADQVRGLMQRPMGRRGRMYGVHGGQLLQARLAALLDADDSGWSLRGWFLFCRW
jgi:hypothetical protein